MKPNVCATESWLKGIQPGKNPLGTQLGTLKYSPLTYRAYRTNRGSLGGGAFVLIHEDLVSNEQPEVVTACEIAWAKIQLRGHRDLFKASVYTPHREQTHLDQLISLMLRPNSVVARKKIPQSVVTNYPDLSWESGTVPPCTSDRSVQEKLIEVSLRHHLTQIHEFPTRQGSHLDLVFTTNPSLTNASVNVPGLSDHNAVILDSCIGSYRTRQKPRRRFHFGKANWEGMRAAVSQLFEKLREMYKSTSDVETLLTAFNNDLLSATNKHVPS